MPRTKALGIHTGPVIAGYTGTLQRATYTCVGDTVNLAARLEAAGHQVARGDAADRRVEFVDRPDDLVHNGQGDHHAEQRDHEFPGVVVEGAEELSDQKPAERMRRLIRHATCPGEVRWFASLWGKLIRRSKKTSLAAQECVHFAAVDEASR